MWSYPNLMPLPAREVERIAAALEPWAYDRIYGAWWEQGHSQRRARTPCDRGVARVSCTPCRATRDLSS